MAPAFGVLIGMAASTSLWAAADTGGTLEEIVVTAQRVEENVQKTPMNVTVVSGEDIQKQGLSNMQEVLNNIPGVTVQGQVRGYNPSVRGLGTDLPPGSSQGAVATEADGVYDVRAESGRIGFFDLARVEVLAGPQGTLYGVNSDGGVVNIISNSPTLDRMSSSGQLQVGNYNLVRGEGVLNVPMSGTSAFRFAVASINRKGYLDTGANDAVGTGARVKYLYKPSDAFSLLAGIEINRLGGKGAGSVNQYNNGDATHPYFNGAPVTIPTPWTDATSAFYGAPFALGGGINDNAQFDDYHSTKYWVDVNWDLGFGSLQILPSYKDNYDQTLACGMGPCNYGADPRKLEQNSEEVRLSSPAGQAFKWAVGLYHWGYLQNTVGGPGGPNGTTVYQTSDGVFGEVTVPFSDRFRGRAGLRETRDWKNANNVPAPASWNHLDYRGGLEYDVTDQSMAYLTVATGYRPGGFNNPAPGSSAPPLYKPESVRDVEVGLKSRYLDNRLQLNVDAFYYNYKDYQLLDFYSAAGNYCSPFDPRNPPFAFPPTVNLSAKNLGLDLALSALVTDSDTINLSAEYLNAKFTSNAVISYNPIDSCAAFNANPAANPDEQVTVGSYVIDNAPQPRAPKTSATLSWEHRFKFDSGANLALRPVVHYSASQYVHPVEYAVSFQPAYTSYEASLTWSSADDKWSLAAWGRNLSNEAIKVSLNPMMIGEPRTYGLTLSARM